MFKTTDTTIAVIAGTPIDTQMGVDFIKGKGLDALAFETASNPQEQNKLQFLYPDVLTEKVIDIIKHLNKKGISRVMIYCNSLSAAINMEYVRDCCPNADIITPLDIYGEIASNFDKILLWAANGQSLAGIEKVMYEANPSIEIIGVSMLPVIVAIEKQEPPDIILKQFNLTFLCQKNPRIQALVLGCTHLPYLTSVLLKDLDISIVDPTEKMLEYLTK